MIILDFRLQNPLKDCWHQLIHLKKNSEPKDKIVALDIGELGYRTGLYIIDLAGLVTPWIAKSPGLVHNKDFDLDKMFSYSPKFILLEKSRKLTKKILDHKGMKDYDLEKVGIYSGGHILIFKLKSS